MKQILQSLRTGATEIADVPAPSPRRGHVLIRTERSLVSAGTERMLVEFGKAGWIAKARSQPDKVRQVLDKVKTDGIAPTVETVFNKLDQPLPLGYCNVGIAMEVGAGVSGFTAGDRVVSNGRHAEVVNVPSNLCARVPDGVSADEAAFTVLAAIGLQGVRLAEPTLGECVVVTGLGLIGLVTVQLLRANGCRVLGVDFDKEKLALARQFGADVVDLSAGQDPVAAAQAFSRGRGVDAVLITASTKSNEPVHQAALMCRKRGRIVLVGLAGLELSRADFYEKELSFQVSCSYGPGRYDPAYEEKGFDYPVGFVRWTEQRNFEAVLDLIASRQLDVKPLISHRFAVERAGDAYALISSPEPSLGVVLEYATPDVIPDATLRAATVHIGAAAATLQRGSVAFIGSGNYATSVLIPSFKEAGAHLHTVVSAAGVTGLHAGRKHGFAQTSTDTNGALGDPAVDTVVIATRHDSHASLVLQGLNARKHVFVEKPLALTMDDVSTIADAVRRSGRILMVGFNRRFSPLVARAQSLLASQSAPRAIVITVNAGAIPVEHWTQDPAVGGGRIIGEGCHFIDLARFLAGASVTDFQVASLDEAGGPASPDKVMMTLRFENGSIATIQYLANGHKSFPKERVEVFVGGRVLQLDNFRKLTGYGWPGFSSVKLWRQDKGQRACAAAFMRSVTHGEPAPIPLEEIAEVSRLSIEIGDALR